MTVVDRIADLISSKGFAASSFLPKIGLSSTALTEWKKGKAKPSTDAIIKLSNFFGVTTDYLLKGKGDANTAINHDKHVVDNGICSSEEYVILANRFQDTINSGITDFGVAFDLTTLSASEYRLIDRWNDLDDDGKAMVESTIISEERRMNADAKTPAKEKAS